MRGLAGSAVLAVFVVGVGAAQAAPGATPEVCGSSGCTPLPTATLQGLLTLPEALSSAEAPPAREYVVFRVRDLDGRRHLVLYVTSPGGALLRFAGTGWRRVPVDDAKLLLDAAAATTPYPPPTTGQLRSLFAAEPRRRSVAPWLALAGILALAAIVFATAERRRRR